MKLATTREVYAYWNALRRARAAPERGEFDPAAIRDSLPDLFILEIDAAGRWPVRLSGTRLDAAFGPLIGRSFLEIFAPGPARREAARLLRAVADDHEALVCGLSAVTPHGRGPDFEFLALPLRDGGRTHRSLIGALAAAGPPALAAPTLRLGEPATLRILRSEESRAAAPPAPPAAPRRRGHLVVYEGGKR
ncbi:MAG: PAS domain-containing protein [Methylobacteriaceae bacterium]|nr:PAS domain-containing protein [Methylobacteriaceae bacterium]